MLASQDSLEATAKQLRTPEEVDVQVALQQQGKEEQIKHQAQKEADGREPVVRPEQAVLQPISRGRSVPGAGLGQPEGRGEAGAVRVSR